MAVTVRALVAAKAAESSQTSQYTCPAATRAIIDKFTATNTSANSATLSVNIVTTGGTAADGNLITKTKAIAAGEVYTFPELVGHVLEPGGFISTLASAATSITIRASGREIS